MLNRGMVASLSRQLPTQKEEPPVVKIRTGDGTRRNRRRRPLGHSVPQPNIIFNIRCYYHLSTPMTCG